MKNPFDPIKGVFYSLEFQTNHGVCYNEKSIKYFNTIMGVNYGQ